MLKTILSDERSPINRNMIILKSIFVIIILISQIPSTLTGLTDVGWIFDTIAFLITVIDTCLLLPYSYKSYKKSKGDPLGKKYLYFSVVSLSIFGALLCFLIDRITILISIPGLFGGVGYSIFYFLRVA